MKTYTWKEAFEDALEGAKAGHPRYQTLAGYCYDMGRDVARDRKQARRWYQKAAKNGNVAAMFTLRVMNNRGQGHAATPPAPYVSMSKPRRVVICKLKQTWQSCCSMGTASRKTLRPALCGCGVPRGGATRRPSTILGEPTRMARVFAGASPMLSRACQRPPTTATPKHGGCCNRSGGRLGDFAFRTYRPNCPISSDRCLTPKMRMPSSSRVKSTR
jgi:hypothetical protein